jgi:uncharacterized membrane protein
MFMKILIGAMVLSLLLLLGAVFGVIHHIRKGHAAQPSAGHDTAKPE